MSLDAGGVTLLGKIDMVTERGSKLEIVDYKTGEVLGDDGHVKVEHAEQLQLYAGMLKEMHGSRAEILTLVDRTGREHSVSVNWSRIEELMNAAVQSIQEFGAVWPSQPSSDVEILATYQANPSDENCSRCGFRHRCEAHRTLMGRVGRVPLGRAPRAFESTDLYGRIESASTCSLGWAIRLRSPAGPIHIRGPMPSDPKVGDRIYAFGVAPGPKNPTPEVDEANDFIVPRWSVIQTESDASDFLDWPTAPLHGGGSKGHKQQDRDIRPGDICLKVAGGSHVDRLTFDSNRWQSERYLEAPAMSQFFLAYFATLLEIKRLITSESSIAPVIWCPTEQSARWLDGVPEKSMKSASSWPAYFKELHAWWLETKQCRTLEILKETRRPGYSNGPVTTIHLDGKALARIAKPASALPNASTREPIGTVIPVLVEPESVEGTHIESTTTDLHMPSQSVSESPKPDVEILASVRGSRGPGQVTIVALTDMARKLELTNAIESASSTANALALLGILSVAKEVVESGTDKISVRCNNNTAITWFGNCSMGKAKTDDHDPETLKMISSLLAWLADLESNGEVCSDAVKANPQERRRPSVTLVRNGQRIFQVGESYLP